MQFLGGSVVDAAVVDAAVVGVAVVDATTRIMTSTSDYYISFSKNKSKNPSRLSLMKLTLRDKVKIRNILPLQLKPFPSYPWLQEQL